MYALHALLNFKGGRTNEATVECKDLDEVFERIRQLVNDKPNFRAVTLLHVEDLPLTLQGAYPLHPRM